MDEDTIEEETREEDVEDEDSILVFTSDVSEVEERGEEEEGKLLKRLKPEQLAQQMRKFLEKIGNVLEQTPQNVGGFHFEEFEVHADITAKGQLALFGTGGELGGTGGLKFVFRRPKTTNQDKQSTISPDNT